MGKVKFSNRKRSWKCKFIINIVVFLYLNIVLFHLFNNNEMLVLGIILGKKFAL